MALNRSLLAGLFVLAPALAAAAPVAKDTLGAPQAPSTNSDSKNLLAPELSLPGFVDLTTTIVDMTTFKAAGKVLTLVDANEKNFGGQVQFPTEQAVAAQRRVGRLDAARGLASGPGPINFVTVESQQEALPGFGKTTRTAVVRKR
jgi:hypothetical protein